MANPEPALGQRLGAWWQEARTQAQTCNIERAEVDYLVRWVTGRDRLDLLQSRGEAVDSTTLQTLDDLWRQRVQYGIPVQYLTGVLLWRNFVLHVRSGVLIPRPETELLVDEVLAELAGTPVATVVDVGTGSGCLALALAQALRHARVLAVDCSSICLEVARQNAHRLGLGVTFLEGSWLEPVQEPVDVIVSNPPYIPSAQVATLEPEVRDHEPQLALDGGPDGLQAFRELAHQAPRVLRSGGLWAVEVMQGQAVAVVALLAQTGWYQDIVTRPDLEGNERFVLARLRHRDGFNGYDKIQF
ncbi:peptide chain release factor N(5)-glutamine methyltransferase [Anthocerotibacter panamensis]|uniref:peptide chain release factor N(5)-glutamine methyltransferase n=1 Tax=Anthocerotibacter panamensis TaxID=2857077 RepID=UPI001C4014ED|nr:peptide chain release factor N(5)-glutamine methyltransferase [Anthocerotibacter panamensis]